MHEAGHAVVGGVPTTRYNGTIAPSAVLPHLSAGLRKLLTPMLSQIQGRLQVSYWIDAQHRIRKVSEVETVAGQHVDHDDRLHGDQPAGADHRAARQPGPQHELAQRPVGLGRCLAVGHYQPGRPRASRR